MTDAPNGEIIVYEAPDGSAQVDVRLERETVWLSQQQMADLFGRERSVVTKHILSGSWERPRQNRLAPASLLSKNTHRAE